MSRSPQIKRARWPKMDEVSRESLLESYNLVNDAAWWRAGRAAVSFCMRPPRRGECSGASHWPVECDSATGQGVFEYADTM